MGKQIILLEEVFGKLDGPILDKRKFEIVNHVKKNIAMYTVKFCKIVLRTFKGIKYTN